MSKTTIHSFVPIQKLGEGTFSSVYKVRRVSDNKIYALKKIKMTSLKEKEKVNALNQIRILASLCSQHIVTYKEAFFDEQLKLLCIVMDCANEGDLLQKINKAKSAHTYIGEREIWKAIYQILMGLMTLHRHNILHRDLKSANIFVNNGNYKIGDLNVSKINTDHKLVKTQTGTPYYASPQIWRDQPYDYKSDIWSFGCIIFEMCCLQPPFQGNSLDELYKNIQKGSFQRIPERYSWQLMEIVSQCLSLKAEKRPNAEELLKHGGIIRSKCQFYQIKIEEGQNLGKKQPLLSTIKMPYDINSLNTNLPHAKYETEDKKVSSLPAMPIKNQKETEIKQIKIEANNSKVVTQTKNKQSSVTKQKQHLTSLPERIKNHLKGMAQRNINDITAHRRPKTRIQTAHTRPHNNLLQHQLPNFSNIIPSASINKRRPFSCDLKNRLNSKPVNNSQPFTALQQRNKRVVTALQQQKSELYSLQKDRAQYRRKIQTQHSYVGHNYKGGINKQRCRSAVIKNDSNISKEPMSSSYIEMRKRLENRQKQMHFSQHGSATKNNSYVNKVPYKENQVKSRQISSHRLPPLITKQVYLRNAKQNKQQNGFLQENKAYLMEIQNKLLGGCSSKVKKCSYILNSQFPCVQQNRLKQLLRKQNIFQGKYNI